MISVTYSVSVDGILTVSAKSSSDPENAIELEVEADGLAFDDETFDELCAQAAEERA